MSESQTLPEELHDLPAWAPGARELADLELLLTGAYRPLDGFMTAADVAAVAEGGRLADGTPWPSPVTLTVPADYADEADEQVAPGRRAVLTDPEGVPLATVDIDERWDGTHDRHIAGRVAPLRAPEHGPFRRLRQRPEQVRAALAPGPVLAAVVDGPLHRPDVAGLRHAATELGASVLVLPAIAGGRPESLVRAVLAGLREPEGATGTDATVVPLPLARRGRPAADSLLGAHVAAAYGATHLFAPEAPEGAPLPVVTPPELVYDTGTDTWRGPAETSGEHRYAPLGQQQVSEMLDAGEALPRWFTTPAVAAELRRVHPPRHERGLTVFFTGLSGSGKSTVARELHDSLLERGREATLLDGDVVRRMLSAGLTFSRQDRDRNIRRIGFVAAEVTRHGGVAICAPIAPYAATRADVARMVSEVGDFVLVHVATPLEVCEERDRKGLYAKARAGLIAEFTGISDPYEEPETPDLRLDTAHVSAEQAVATVMNHLTDGGWVR